jgi:hypothetical protein
MQLPDPPSSLVEFCRMFPTETECSAYLLKIRWPDGFTCPQCQHEGGYSISGRNTVECSNPACRHQTSVTAGTALHRSKQSLHTWFWAAFLFTNLTPSISAKQFQRQLGISRYETAFCMLHKLRAALVAPGRDKLHGEIEVDEGYIGGKEEGCIGRGSNAKQIVVGAVEVLQWKDPATGKRRTRCGRVRLQIIPDVSGGSLREFVLMNIARGSRVTTDGLQSYSFLKISGYEHRRKVQSDSEDSLKYFHRVFSNLKTWLKGTFHGNTCKKHLQSYLNEYAFRFNRRLSSGECFNRALGLAMKSDAPTYEALYNSGEPGGWSHPLGAHRDCWNSYE